MRSTHGYKLRAQTMQQQRPAGVAILAILGVLGSLAVIVVALVRLLTQMQAIIGPNIQLGVLAGVLALALVSLWINWGFWELIQWAWWANLLLTLLVIAGLVTTLRFAQPLGATLAKLRQGLTEGRATSGVLAAIVALLALQLVVVIYLLSVRTVFKVRVKEDRPLWERMQRH